MQSSFLNVYSFVLGYYFFISGIFLLCNTTYESIVSKERQSESVFACDAEIDANKREKPSNLNSWYPAEMAYCHITLYTYIDVYKVMLG